MGFERVEKQQQTNNEEPSASAYPDGSIRFNAVAGRRWFDSIETTDVLIDRETNKVAFDPGYDGVHARSVTPESNNHAVSVSCRAPLRQLGYEIPLEETIACTVERDEESGLVIVALNGAVEDKGSEGVESESDASETRSADEDEDEDEVVAKEEEETFGELEQLREIPYVGGTKIQLLHDAGYETIEELQEATAEEIASIEGAGKPLAERIVNAITDPRADDEDEEDSQEDSQPDQPRPDEGGEPDEDDGGREPDCEWLSGDPNEIISKAYGARSGSRDLDEVLDAIEQADNSVALNQRLALGGVSTTRSMLFNLGLAKPSGSMLDPRERSERIAAMREAYL